MGIDGKTKNNIKISIRRTRKRNLNTAVVLQACCYIDGLGRKLFGGKSGPRFKKYVKKHMPDTYDQLRKRSRQLSKGGEYCLNLLYSDIRCGLVHEIDPKSKSFIIGRRGKTIVHLIANDQGDKGKDLVLCSPLFIDDFLNSIGTI